MDKATDLRVGKWLHCSALELLLYLQESDYQWHKCCKLDEGGKWRLVRCWAASLSRGNHLGAVFLKYISFQEMLKLNCLQQITLSFVRRYSKTSFQSGVSPSWVHQLRPLGNSVETLWSPGWGRRIRADSYIFRKRMSGKWNLAADRDDRDMGEGASEEAAISAEEQRDQLGEKRFQQLMISFDYQHRLVTVSSCTVVLAAASAMIAE